MPDGAARFFQSELWGITCLDGLSTDGGKTQFWHVRAARLSLCSQVLLPPLGVSSMPSLGCFKFGHSQNREIPVPLAKYPEERPMTVPVGSIEVVAHTSRTGMVHNLVAVANHTVPSHALQAIFCHCGWSQCRKQWF